MQTRRLVTKKARAARGGGGSESEPSYALATCRSSCSIEWRSSGSGCLGVVGVGVSDDAGLAAEGVAEEAAASGATTEAAAAAWCAWTASTSIFSSVSKVCEGPPYGERRRDATRKRASSTPPHHCPS